MKADFKDIMHLDFQRTQEFLILNARGVPVALWLQMFYPENSCQPSSSYLARALETRHQQSSKYIVMKGTGSKGTHFWVASGRTRAGPVSVDPFNVIWHLNLYFDIGPHPSQELYYGT